MNTKSELDIERADALFAQERFREAHSFYSSHAARGALIGTQSVRYAIAGLEVGAVASIASVIDKDLATREARHLAALEIMPRLLRSLDTSAYDVFGSRLVAVDSVGDREILGWASALQKQSEDAVAIDLLKRGVARFDDSPVLEIKLLQLWLAIRQTEEAADFAERWPAWSKMGDRLAYLVLLALERDGRSEAVVTFHERFAEEVAFNQRAIVLVMGSLDAVGQLEEAIRLGEASIARMPNTGHSIHNLLGQLYEKASRIDGAIEHYGLALDEDPDSVQTNAALGRLLLAAGRPKRATECLHKVARSAPHLVHPRMLLARGLKQTGAHAEAADVMAGIDPEAIAENFVARRQVVSALSLAGRKKEAAERYDAMLLEREELLPANFAEGLAGLEERVEKVELPRERFDWAWELRDASVYSDRSAWERRAKWGYLADQLMLDWLECRTEEAEQAMRLLVDLGDADRFVGEARAGGESLIIASAHVGALYAGPLALELLGLPCRWLASAPSTSHSPYQSSLISTSDQTEAQVARSVIRAMDAGDAIVLAVDGAMSMSAPRAPFAGREVTYSAFAARLAYRRNAVSLFAAPIWTEDRQIEIWLRPMPRAAEGEDLIEFSRRWRAAYFAHVGSILRGRPENLRLSGGIWREVR